MSELNQQKNDIERQLENHEGADKDYYISLNLLLELAQNAGKLFRSASVEQKRTILKLVYWNLELHDGKVQYSLRKPFDVLLDSAKTENWLHMLDVIGTSHYTELVQIKPLLEAVFDDLKLVA